MIVAILMLVQQMPDVPVPMSQLSVGESYTLPDSIKPMFDRYQQCLSDSFNAQLRASSSDRSQTPAMLRAMPAKSVTECGPSRESEFDRAYVALKADKSFKGNEKDKIDELFQMAERNYRTSAEQMARSSEQPKVPVERKAVGVALDAPVPIARLKLPDEIGSAFVPYIMCRNGANNRLLAGLSDRSATGLELVTESSKNECEKDRNMSARRADGVLRMTDQNLGQRRSAIRKAFESIDQMFSLDRLLGSAAPTEAKK